MTKTMITKTITMVITTMTNSAAHQKKKGASRNSKVISTSLAVATGVGVVGLLALQQVDQATANTGDQVQESEINSEVTSSDGYTKAQLDAYALALEQEAQRLRDYRDELAAIASDVNSPSGASDRKTKPASKSAPTAAPALAITKARPAPAAKPAPQTQSKAQAQAQSQGSD